MEPPRSRRRRSTLQAFRDPECGRCAQEPRSCGDRVLGEDSESSALLVSIDSCPFSSSSPSSSPDPPSPSQSGAAAAKMERSIEEEEDQVSAKKRRASSWSGLVLPRLCSERSATDDACKKLGFVVMRKMRALSLDDDLQDLSSRMNFLSTGDTTFLDPLLKPDSAPAPNPSDLRVKNVDSHRCQSFDSRRYDLGPKILLLADRSTARDEQGESSFKCPASVPFKWEEAPGKPKPGIDQTPVPSLQLPPRLLLRSATTNSSSGTGFSQRRARSVNHNQGLLLAPPVPRGAAAASIKPEDAKPVDQSIPRGKSTGPSSPTSILHGPDASSASCSASSSDAVSDSAVVSDAESGTVCTKSVVANPGCFKSGSGGDGGGCSFGGAKRVSLARSIERVLHPDQWLRSKRKKFRGSQDVEMWAPTLAAYFHSIEGSDTAAEEPPSVPSSGQIVLLQPSGEDEEEESSSVSSSKVVSMPGLNESDRGGVGFEESAAAGVMYCGCASPRLAPSRFRLMRGSSSAGQRKWMVARIRKSSRLLQMFVFKAVRCAVQPRAKSAVESKLIYHPVKG